MHHPEVLEGGARHAQKAMLDFEDFFAYHRQIEPEQQVIDLVNRPGRAVLDRQNSPLHQPLLDGFERRSERSVGLEHHRTGAGAEVLARGLMSVGTLRPLEADHQRRRV